MAKTTTKVVGRSIYDVEAEIRARLESGTGTVEDRAMYPAIAEAIVKIESSRIMNTMCKALASCDMTQEELGTIPTAKFEFNVEDLEDGTEASVVISTKFGTETTAKDAIKAELAKGLVYADASGVCRAVKTNEDYHNYRVANNLVSPIDRDEKVIYSINENLALALGFGDIVKVNKSTSKVDVRQKEVK